MKKSGYIVLAVLGIFSLLVSILWSGCNNSNPTAPEGPALLSPTGKILFESDRDGNMEIYCVNADGTDLQRLTNNTSADSGPKWSPDGNSVIFVSNRDGNNEIYRMNSDGSGQVNLTNDPGADGCCSWSPDGNRILYVGNNTLCDMDSNGGSKRAITGCSGQSVLPAYSPDGSRILFAPSVYGLRVINSDGSNGIDVLSGSEVADGADWSPDSGKVVYSSGLKNHIFNISDLSTTELPLTGESASDKYPKWSPDSDLIAYIHYEINILIIIPVGSYSLHTVKPDGTGAKYLMKANGNIAWAPGQDIIAARRDIWNSGSFNSDIYLTNLTGDAASQLAGSVYYDSAPDWH